MPLSPSEFPHLVQNRKNICMKKFWRIQYFGLYFEALCIIPHLRKLVLYNKKIKKHLSLFNFNIICVLLCSCFDIKMNYGYVAFFSMERHCILCNSDNALLALNLQCTVLNLKGIWSHCTDGIVRPIMSHYPRPIKGCVYHLSQVRNTFQYPLSKCVKTKERRF